MWDGQRWGRLRHVWCGSALFRRYLRMRRDIMLQRLLQRQRVRGLHQPVGRNVRDGRRCLLYLRFGTALSPGSMHLRRDLLPQWLLQWHDLREPDLRPLWDGRRLLRNLRCGTVLFRRSMRVRRKLVPQRVLQRQPVRALRQPERASVRPRRGRVCELFRRRRPRHLR